MDSNEKLLVTLCREAGRVEEDAHCIGILNLSAASAWKRRHYGLGILATTFSGLAALASAHDFQVAAGLLSFFTAILVGVMMFLKPCQRAEQHKVVGEQFLSLRNDARIFRETEVWESDDVEALSEKVRVLSARCGDLNHGRPQVSRKIFEQARKASEKDEAAHDANK